MRDDRVRWVAYAAPTGAGTSWHFDAVTRGPKRILGSWDLGEETALGIFSPAFIDISLALEASAF